jgi:hypothetical protein
MKLLKHKNARDIAVEFLCEHKDAGTYTVACYNINSAKVSGQNPMFICYMDIPIDRVNMEDYTEVEV